MPYGYLHGDCYIHTVQNIPATSQQHYMTISYSKKYSNNICNIAGIFHMYTWQKCIELKKNMVTFSSL